MLSYLPTARSYRKKEKTQKGERKMWGKGTVGKPVIRLQKNNETNKCDVLVSLP